MSRIIVLILLATIVLYPNYAPDAVAADQSPLSLTIRTPNDHPLLGDPISIEVTIKNISPTPVTIPVRNIDVDYTFVVRDPHGVAPQETERLQRVKDKTKPPFIFRAFPQTLKPDESSQEKFDITDYYEFVDPGEYSMQVIRQIGRHKTDVVPSDTIYVTVTAKQK